MSVIFIDIPHIGYICIWLMLTDLITIFLSYLDTAFEHLKPESLCDTTAESTSYSNGTTSKWVRHVIDVEKCNQLMMETKMGLTFIKVGISLLLVFFGMKSTNAIEKVSLNLQLF